MRESNAVERYADWETPETSEYQVGDKTYKHGDLVRVRRTNGNFEDNWMFGGYRNERVLVFNQLHQVKSVEPEEFLSWQKPEHSRLIHIGDTVKVKRSDGNMESDWILKSIRNGRAQVEKIDDNGNTLEKSIDFEKFRTWQL